MKSDLMMSYISQSGLHPSVQFFCNRVNIISYVVVTDEIYSFIG